MSRWLNRTPYRVISCRKGLGSYSEPALPEQATGTEVAYDRLSNCANRCRSYVVPQRRRGGTASTATPLVTNNLARLEPGFFESHGPEQLSLVIHELGHAHARRAMEHGPKWGRACTTVGAMIVLGLTSE